MHLSIQSGSDTILNAMHRRHNSETVRRIVKAANNNITFSWDIICGFPGETEELFNETLKLARETKPIKIHAFPFSPPPGTEAADLPNKINRQTSKKRVKIIPDPADNFKKNFITQQLSTQVQVSIK